MVIPGAQGVGAPVFQSVPLDPLLSVFFFFSSRRRHTRLQGDWSSDVCSSDLPGGGWTTATEMAKLVASDASLNSLFGSSVSADGNTLAIGAHARPGGGAAYLDRKSVV